MRAAGFQLQVSASCISRGIVQSCSHLYEVTQPAPCRPEAASGPGSLLLTWAMFVSPGLRIFPAPRHTVAELTGLKLLLEAAEDEPSLKKKKEKGKTV